MDRFVICGVVISRDTLITVIFHKSFARAAGATANSAPQPFWEWLPDCILARGRLRMKYELRTSPDKQAITPMATGDGAISPI